MKYYEEATGCYSGTVHGMRATCALTEVAFTFRELRLASTKGEDWKSMFGGELQNMEKPRKVFAKGGKRVNTRQSAGFRSGDLQQRQCFSSVRGQRISQSPYLGFDLYYSSCSPPEMDVIARTCLCGHVCEARLCCCCDSFCMLCYRSAAPQFFRVKHIWFFSEKKESGKTGD